MATFKIKHEKHKHLIEINTLDETHKKFMMTFQNRKTTLPRKKKKLDLLRLQLTKLEKTNASSYTIEDIKKRSLLKTEIKELEDEIYDIENDLSEIDYYSRTEDIIMDYYEIIDNDDHNLYNDNPELCEEKLEENNDNEPDKLDILNMMNKIKKKPKKITKRRKKKIVSSKQVNILDFFNGNITIPINNDYTEMTETDMDTENFCYYETESSDKIISDQNNNHDEISNKQLNEQKNKAELLDQYMMLIDSEYICDKKRMLGQIRKCLDCGIEKTLIHAEGIFVCQSCGEAEPIIIDSEKPNYKEAATDTKPGYPYKRIKWFVLKSILQSISRCYTLENSCDPCNRFNLLISRC